LSLFNWSGTASRGKSAQRLVRVGAVGVESLESRLLMHGLHDHGDGLQVHPLPHGPAETDATAAAGISAAANGLLPLTSLQALHSRPGARATLFLDFDGAPAAFWGTYAVPATDAYDYDGSVATFSSGERDSIARIWAHVAEKFSPFDIDVTTVDPGAYVDGTSLRVVVGGNGSWIGMGGVGGVAYAWSFANFGSWDLNTVYVFSSNFGGAGSAPYIADAVAHEAGHGFGLHHQSTFDPVTGSKVDEYNPGTASAAPIMGTSYYAERGLWWEGPNTDAATQDDLAVIADKTGAYSLNYVPNKFGYRADDHAGTSGAATALARSGPSLTGSGVIERASDTDSFSFSTTGGSLSFTLRVAEHGAMLDATLMVLAEDGTVVASVDTVPSLGADGLYGSESVALSLGRGTYRVVVASSGSYGSVGQYRLTGRAPLVAAPALSTAFLVSANVVRVRWSDVSDETGFLIQRSADGGAWVVVGTMGADVTEYHETVKLGHAYAYRIVAQRGSESSNPSGTVTVTVAPAGPGGLVATESSGNVLLTWNAVDGATGYVVEVSDNGGAAWKILAVRGAGTTQCATARPQAGSMTVYRVSAATPRGQTHFSDHAVLTVAPAAPAALSANARAERGKVLLSWTESQGASAYAVERSTNVRRGWTRVAVIASDAKGWADVTAAGRRRYYYRVVALNDGGASAGSRTANAVVQPPPKGRKQLRPAHLAARPTTL
jgi:hypothetical protein